MDFGSKSESSDFARKTHFSCTYFSSQIWILDRNLKAMILPGKRILAVHMQKPNPYPLENSSHGFWKILDRNLKSMILPGKRILHVHMQKPNPYPLENSPQIWILDRNLKAVILPGKRMYICRNQTPTPWKIVPNMDFGSKSESNDFARRTHFSCKYAETKPLPPGK